MCISFGDTLCGVSCTTCPRQIRDGFFQIANQSLHNNITVSLPYIHIFQIAIRSTGSKRNISEKANQVEINHCTQHFSFGTEA